MLTEGGGASEDRLAFASAGHGPQPRAPEVDVLKNVLQRQREIFRQNAVAPRPRLLASGKRRAMTGWDAAELAAWTRVASTILNLTKH